MGYRVQRVEKIIERELASIIFSEVHNELIKFVSITKVALNKDMSVALVWYTVLGNDGEIEATKKALDQALLAANINELQDLISIDIKTALLVLGEITGEVVTDELLNNIFDSFCIGK